MRTRSILDSLSTRPWFVHDRSRRGIVAGLAIVMALLAVYPRAYVAKAQMVTRASLANACLLDNNALTGGRPSYEIDFSIARSHVVQRAVAALIAPQDIDATELDIRRNVTVSLIRDGIFQIAVTHRDPATALAITRAYADTLSARFAALGRAARRGDARADAAIATLDPPYVDPDRPVNITPAALLAMLIVLGIAAEIYILRPPAGIRPIRRPA